MFLALYDLAKKASVRDNAVLPTLLVSTCFGCAAYVAVMALSGRFASAAELTREVVALSAVKCAIVGTSWVFTFRALKTLPISIATPIRASAPALVFVIALFLYGERPSPLQAAGMATVFAGYFAFSWAGRHEGIDFFRDRAVWCAVAGAFFAALSAIWDKYLFQVRGLPVDAVQLVFQIGLVVFYAAALAAEGFVAKGGSSFEWRWSHPPRRGGLALFQRACLPGRASVGGVAPAAVLGGDHLRPWRKDFPRDQPCAQGRRLGRDRRRRRADLPGIAKGGAMAWGAAPRTGEIWYNTPA